MFSDMYKVCVHARAHGLLTGVQYKIEGLSLSLNWRINVSWDYVVVLYSVGQCPIMWRKLLYHACICFLCKVIIFSSALLGPAHYLVLIVIVLNYILKLSYDFFIVVYFLTRVLFYIYKTVSRAPIWTFLIALSAVYCKCYSDVFFPF